MRKRTFILIAVAVFAVLVGGFAYVALSGGDDERRVGALSRSYTSGKALLSLAGEPLGYLKSASCGVVGADVTRQSPELVKGGGIDPKQIGPAKYEPCQLTFGLQMEPALYSWINDVMGGKASARNLTIHNLTYDYKEVSALELNQALLTEFSMPAFDGASNAAAYMTITVKAPTIVGKPGSNAVMTAKTASSQKNVLESNFKLEVGGQEAKKLTTMSSFGFEIPAGTERPMFRDFTVTVSNADPAPFDKLLQTFVIEGQNGPAYEKPAKLMMLDSTLANTLATLSLTGVGVSNGDMVGILENSADTVARRRYTLYAEGASLTIAP